MNARAARQVLVSGLTAAAIGCGATSDSLILTTYTKVGLDVSTVEAQPAEAVFGYKRFEGAIVPVDENLADKEAHSTFAGICIRNSWLRGLDIGQVFATGDAAEIIASQTTRAEEVARILDCGDKQKPETPAPGTDSPAPTAVR